MSEKISRDGDTWEVFSRTEQWTGRERRFHDAEDARRLLAEFRDEPVSIDNLRTLVSEVQVARDLSLVNHDVFERRAAQMFRDRELGLRFERIEIAGAGSSDDPTSGLDDDPAEDDTDETHWIEIELRDADGNPVPGARFELTLPDGTTRTGSLNFTGVLRIEGLDPGSCTLRFPDHDSREITPA